MSSNDIQQENKYESIPEETLEKMSKTDLIKVIRLLEGLTKGRRIIGHIVSASIACSALPYLVLALGAFGFAVAPFVGLLVLYAIDQTSLLIAASRKKKDNHPNIKE